MMYLLLRSRRHSNAALNTKQGGDVHRVGVFLGFVWLTTRTEGPHGGASYVRRAGGIGLAAMGVELNGSRRVPGAGTLRFVVVARAERVAELQVVH